MTIVNYPAWLVLCFVLVGVSFVSDWPRTHKTKDDQELVLFLSPHLTRLVCLLIGSLMYAKLELTMHPRLISNSQQPFSPEC